MNKQDWNDIANGRDYPGEKCGLSETEWILENIVDEIKQLTTLEGIGMLRRLMKSQASDKDKEIERLKAGIKWCCDNPQSIFVFNELKKLIEP